MMTELTFDLKGNSYTIKVPEIGNMIDIERLRMVLSGGYYFEMLKNSTFTSQESLMVIDIQATFSILCPQLMEDLKCSDIKKLDAKDYRELRKVYVEKFIPWWNNWLTILKGDKE